ncbi:ElaA protein [Reichenbachiella faecimaris]|uniref:ElaA protein n=1 Tax=Reichenbachiella faecimaris TaxID=692418 RepID=A0A1W2GDN8_REIFA|nr:GNAT family N-acetyltransferase [Reichenbachiella faecimaris]SMD34780.1 ElaA protein [Reichenbachiella faecimaris]
MEIQIKKFHQLSPDQLYQILKLRVDVFVVEQNCPYPELDNSDQSAEHFFVEKDGVPKAYLRLNVSNENKAKISRVVTASDFRGKSASRKLIEKALEISKNQEEIKSVVLQAQDYLTDFYASFGFEKTSDVYLEDGIPHVDMGKQMNRE